MQPSQVVKSNIYDQGVGLTESGSVRSSGLGPTSPIIKCPLCDQGAQGYLAHKNHPPPRTLQKDNTWGPIVVLGGGLFLVGEVSL